MKERVLRNRVEIWEAKSGEEKEKRQRNIRNHENGNLKRQGCWYCLWTHRLSDRCSKWLFFGFVGFKTRGLEKREQEKTKECEAKRGLLICCLLRWSRKKSPPTWGHLMVAIGEYCLEKGCCSSKKRDLFLFSLPFIAIGNPMISLEKRTMREIRLCGDSTRLNQ